MTDLGNVIVHWTKVITLWGKYRSTQWHWNIGHRKLKQRLCLIRAYAIAHWGKGHGTLKHWSKQIKTGHNTSKQRSFFTKVKVITRWGHFKIDKIVKLLFSYHGYRVSVFYFNTTIDNYRLNFSQIILLFCCRWIMTLKSQMMRGISLYQVSIHINVTSSICRYVILNNHLNQSHVDSLIS